MSPILSSQTARAAAAMMALFLALASAPTGAWAQDEDSIEQAKRLFKQGQDAQKDGDDQLASSLFMKSYKLSGRPELLYYIGQAYESSGELALSQRYYQRYLDELPDARNADDVLDIIIGLQERIQSEMGMVQVNTRVDGRSVFVSSEEDPRCDTPCELYLKPGSHDLTVRGDGFEKAEKVSVDAGERKRLMVVIERKESGKLLVRTDIDEGELVVGNRQASLPLSGPLEIRSGNYPLTVRGPKNTWQGDIVIETDETLQIFVPLDHSTGGGGMSSLRATSIGLIGAGVGVIIGGLFMGQQSNQTRDLLVQGGFDPETNNRLVDQGKSQQSAANLLFIIGGVAAASGAGLFTFDLISSAPKGPQPSPTDEAMGDTPASTDPSGVDLLE